VIVLVDVITLVVVVVVTLVSTLVVGTRLMAVVGTRLVSILVVRTRLIAVVGTKLVSTLVVGTRLMAVVGTTEITVTVQVDVVRSVMVLFIVTVFGGGADCDGQIAILIACRSFFQGQFHDLDESNSSGEMSTVLLRCSGALSPLPKFFEFGVSFRITYRSDCDRLITSRYRYRRARHRTSLCEFGCDGLFCARRISIPAASSPTRCRLCLMCRAMHGYTRRPIIVVVEFSE
jgi:hypothetical protein